MTPPIAPMTPACLQVGTASFGGGNSPVLAQYLKSQEKEILTPFLGELNEYMGKIRKRVIEKYDTEEKRKEIFKEIVNTAIENGELPQE